MSASLPENHEGYCVICYTELDDTNSFALECKHTFCTYCWGDMIKDKVKTDCFGIDSTCMQAGCNLKVGHSAYLKFLEDDPEIMDKYWKWLVKSLTDQS